MFCSLPTFCYVPLCTNSVYSPELNCSIEFLFPSLWSNLGIIIISDIFVMIYSDSKISLMVNVALFAWSFFAAFLMIARITLSSFEGGNLGIYNIVTPNYFSISASRSVNLVLP